MKEHQFSNEEYAVFFQQGEERGLQFFYSELHPALSHYANRWVNDRSIAEDIASEAIIRTWKFHAKLDSYGAIKAYLYQATRRLAQRHVLKEKRRNKILQDGFFFKDASATPFDHLVATETYALLRQALKQLCPSYRKVLTMHFLEGKKNN